MDIENKLSRCQLEFDTIRITAKDKETGNVDTFRLDGIFEYFILQYIKNNPGVDSLTIEDQYNTREISRVRLHNGVSMTFEEIRNSNI